MDKVDQACSALERALSRRRPPTKDELLALCMELLPRLERLVVARDTKRTNVVWSRTLPLVRRMIEIDTDVRRAVIQTKTLFH